MSLAEASSPDFVAITRQAIASNVRAMMARRSVTQTWLANQLGVSQPWVSRRVSGEVAFDTDDLIKIAGTLSCDLMADLMDGARSRCFSPLSLVSDSGQMELAFDPAPELALVGAK